MTGSIVKTYVTETAHIVREAVSERCKYNIHGHSYTWEIIITGPIQENGMVLDFKQLKPIKDFIDNFDHACVFWSKEDPEILNFFLDKFKRVIIMEKNCTAENMSRIVHALVVDKFLGNNKSFKVSVRVWETATGSAISNESNSTDNCTFYIKD